MLATWKYKPRDTLIQRFDPRARLIFYGCYLVSVLLFWDLRCLLFFLALAAAAVGLSRLSWRETRQAWVLIAVFAALYALLALVTGRGALDLYTAERVLVNLPAPFAILGWQPALVISMERVFFALSQSARLLSISALTILIPYTFDPALYGVTFRRLGLPDKLSFALDLTLRFVPSLGRDFNATLDAQKARGYELDRRQGGLAQQIRRLAPLIVPVVIHSIVSSDEITDAMDLRAFGAGRRTWLHELAYAPRDYALIISGAALLAASIGLALAGAGRFWTP